VKRQYLTLYTNGKWISTAKLKTRSKRLKLQEIAVLEAYIGKTKSTMLQEMAGNRINKLIKEILK